MSHVIAVLASTLLVALSANAYFEPTSTGENPREMNCIFLEEHKHITKP